jgi:hypothetical protein
MISYTSVIIIMFFHCYRYYYYILCIIIYIYYTCNYIVCVHDFSTHILSAFGPSGI